LKFRKKKLNPNIKKTVTTNKLMGKIKCIKIDKNNKKGNAIKPISPIPIMGIFKYDKNNFTKLPYINIINKINKK
tara:strand:- start:35 stop:259 length:225 start_codon:yes stop_codon:yes gene_type:complete